MGFEWHHSLRLAQAQASCKKIDGISCIFLTSNCRPRAGPASDSAAALKLLEAPALSARDSEARVIALLHCHDDIRSARAAALHRPLTGRNSHWQ